MAKSKGKIKTVPAKTVAQPAPEPHKQPVRPTDDLKRHTRLNIHLAIMAAIGVLTWLVLKVCLNNQFTTWDDPGYLQDNPIIKDLSATGLKHIFSEPVMGNYHPFTILSYALEYQLEQFEPWQYHIDSLLLHVVDTMMVYWLTVLLSRRVIVGVVTALLFGLHTMHVESVAWISGRKDVLYALFYLGACLAYWYYCHEKSKSKWLLYLLVLILFVCSSFSKPVAVTLPLALLAMDYLEKRKWDMRLIIEKIPFFILSLVFGIIALKVQQKAGAMDMLKVVYSPLERLELGGYALCTYLWKAVLPVHLCNYYPYPAKVNGAIPALYYLYPLAVAGLVFAVWKWLRRDRIVMFGLLFFLAHIVFLLQFVQVGDAILADRYSYMPYLGLFYIAGWGVAEAFENSSLTKWKIPVLSIAVVYLVWLSFESNNRCMAWSDAITLWRDEIDKEPNTEPIAYNNLGYIYAGKCDAATNIADKNIFYDSTIYFLNKAISLQPDFVNPYITVGNIERNMGHYDAARDNYYRIMKRKPKESNVYVGLAILYSVMKQFDSAGYWFREAIKINPAPESYSNYGNYLAGQGKYDSAIQQYNVAIKGNPFYYVPVMSRGESYMKLNQFDSAIADYNAAIKISPESGEIYYRRSFYYTQKGKKDLALQDVEKAMSLGYSRVDNNYMNFLKSR